MAMSHLPLSLEVERGEQEHLGSIYILWQNGIWNETSGGAIRGFVDLYHRFGAIEVHFHGLHIVVLDGIPVVILDGIILAGVNGLKGGHFDGGSGRTYGDKRSTEVNKY